MRRAGLLLLLAAAAWHAGHAAWIEVKARLAQHLVRAAWQRTLAGERQARPWPWADTHPVARLVVPGQRVELFVLAGASGRTMAFGPGHVDGTARPGEAGNAVVSGHRDTHFAFLRRLREGDAILVERPDGVVRRYAVRGARIVDRRETWVASHDFDDTRLTLVTCYPFDAVRPGGPLRYVVTARLADAAGSDTLTGPPPVRAAARRARAAADRLAWTGDHPP
jgi:sortase A